MNEFGIKKTYGLSFPTRKTKTESKVLSTCVFDSGSDEETKTLVNFVFYMY